MHIHFIQHETFEAPGAFLTWAKRRGAKITSSKVFNKEALPMTIDSIDLLIILGGPQSPDTTVAECSYFDAQAEISTIQECIKKGKAVVGVCLGSQLIGNALGATFEHSPNTEIGVFPIQLTEEGLKDRKLKHFGSSLYVGHWHNDMPGITSESKILATSEGCPRQIIAYSNLVYGFQCHMEFTKDVVELLIENDENILQNHERYEFVQKSDEIMNYDYTEMNNKLHLFLDNLIEEYEHQKLRS